MSPVIVRAACLAALFLSASHAATLTNGVITLTLANSAQGYNPNNFNRVDALIWAGPNGTIGNYVALGGPLHCNDPQEFFGEAYAQRESPPNPVMVFGGDTDTWSSRSALKGTSRRPALKTCDLAPDGATTTTYTLFKAGTALANALKITRSFTFTTKGLTAGLRAYVPRLPNSSYSTVYAPDAQGVVQSYSANCESCIVASWNGTWFADDNGAGTGIVFLRSPTRNRPAVLELDTDAFSGSNNAAVSIQPPQGGWSAPVTETEYACFYDASTWPAASRLAGKLPRGCTGVSIK